MEVQNVIWSVVGFAFMVGAWLAWMATRLGRIKLPHDYPWKRSEAPRLFLAQALFYTGIETLFVLATLGWFR